MKRRFVEGLFQHPQPITLIDSERSAFHLITSVIFDPQSVAAKIVSDTKNKDSPKECSSKTTSLMGVFIPRVTHVGAFHKGFCL
jgi:hypothetical protein